MLPDKELSPCVNGNEISISKQGELLSNVSIMNFMVVSHTENTMDSSVAADPSPVLLFLLPLPKQPIIVKVKNNINE
jgi:hypothetical protein